MSKKKDHLAVGKHHSPYVIRFESLEVINEILDQIIKITLDMAGESDLRKKLPKFSTLEAAAIVISTGLVQN